MKAISMTLVVPESILVGHFVDVLERGLSDWLFSQGDGSYFNARVEVAVNSDPVIVMLIPTTRIDALELAGEKT